MHVLVMESNPGDADEVHRRLVASGHDVSRCHDRDERPFPCKALIDGERCPMEEHDVSAAVLATAPDPPAGQNASEDGVRCALRRRIPVVMVGDVDHSLYRDQAHASVASVDEVVAAVESAAAARLTDHEVVARRALGQVLSRHGVDEADGDAVVRREGGDVLVNLTTSAQLPSAAVETASVRVAGALRQLDPHARRISVAFDGASTTL